MGAPAAPPMPNMQFSLSLSSFLSFSTSPLLAELVPPAMGLTGRLMNLCSGLTLTCMGVHTGIGGLLSSSSSSPPPPTACGGGLMLPGDTLGDTPGDADTDAASNILLPMNPSLFIPLSLAALPLQP
ncbi:hypothetical protein C0989_007210, partial [Termitomyces sp. Mn162]